MASVECAGCARMFGTAEGYSKIEPAELVYCLRPECVAKGDAVYAEQLRALVEDKLPMPYWLSRTHVTARNGEEA